MSSIKIDPEIMGGTPCFTGTRVPVRFLFDYLASGETVASFREGFPTVPPESIDAVLRLASEKVIDSADRVTPVTEHAA